MPSVQHDISIELIKDHPDFAGRLLSLTGADLPPDTHLIPAPTNETDRLLSRDLNPDAVFADRSVEKPRRIVIVEVQRSRSQEKLRQWPRYAAAQWLRHECPVDLLVICTDEQTAQWFARPLPTELDGYIHRPRILMPAQVPAMRSAEEVAADPLMATLAVAYHGLDEAVANAFVAGIASLGADAGRRYYEHGIRLSSTQIRNVLELLVSTKYTEPFSEFGKRHFREGREEGREEGLVEGERGTVRMVLKARRLELSDDQRERLDTCNDLAQLREWAELALTATTTAEVFES